MNVSINPNDLPDEFFFHVFKNFSLIDLHMNILLVGSKWRRLVLDQNHQRLRRHLVFQNDKNSLKNSMTFLYVPSLDVAVQLKKLDLRSLDYKFV